MTNWFRRYIVGILDVSTAEFLLEWWVLGIGSIYQTLRLPVGPYMTHIRMGLWLHQQWLRYWSFWFFYYLKRDRCWLQTQEQMLRNCLCPIGVWDYYKKLVFEMNPEEITKFLPTEHDRELYRQRQLRCGCVPQI